MTTEIAKPFDFDPGKLAEQLRDKIRIDMAKLMPDAMWEGLLKKEADKFFAEETERRSYGKLQVITDFGRVVNEVLEEETKRRVKEMLSSSEWAGYWGGQGEVAGERIKELVLENSSQILASLLANSIQGVVSQMNINMGKNNGY